MTDRFVLPTARYHNGVLRIIDQTRLPGTFEERELRTLDDVCEAIRLLRVRGAPAIGVAAAYGLLVALRAPGDAAKQPLAELQRRLQAAATALLATRPTAVNLGWALSRMQRCVAEAPDAASLLEMLEAEAHAILAEDIAMCRAIGEHGRTLLPQAGGVLTHCNTGGLATGGYGTALGVVFAAVDSGSVLHVFADETRPLLQGARLTAWECERFGIPVTVLVDSAAASLISSGRVACAIVGADRIASNGDVANKIGTLGVAILCDRFGVPFYVAAPSSTIDTALRDGSGIPIEERAPEEVHAPGGTRFTPAGAAAWNPAFDVTPAALISAIVTEAGVHRPPYGF